MRSRPFVLLLLLGTAASAETPAPTSTLRFAWPDGMKAKVEVRLQGAREVGGRTQRNDARATFVLSTQGEGDAVQVKREAFSGWKGQLPPGVGSGADRLVDRIPVVRVSKAGEFLGIDGADQAREAFSREVKPKSLDAQNRRVLETVTTDQALNAIALDYWNMSVGIWAQLGLAPGESRELRNRTRVPQLGGGELDLVIGFRWVGPAACAEGDKEKRCVELALDSRPDAKQTQELLKQVLASATDAGPVTEAFEMSQEVRAVVAPETLVPHRLSLKRSVQMRYVVPGGKRETAGEQSERSYVFTYSAPAASPKP